jgi:hypothetical protein
MASFFRSQQRRRDPYAGFAIGETELVMPESTEEQNKGRHFWKNSGFP